MAFLTDDEVDELGTQMAGSGQSGTQYPLAPSYAPQTPTWVDDASGGGYYDDGLGHYSNNGGASWDYTPQPYAQPSYAPQQPAYNEDPYGYNAPVVNEYTAPGEYGNAPYEPWVPPTQQDFVAADRAMDTTNQFQPNWDVMTTPGEEDNGGGWWGGVQNFAGAVGGGLQDFATDFADVAQARYGGGNGSVMGLGSVPGRTREATPEEFLQGANLMTSGNAIANEFGYHPEDLPYGLGYLTDAINPAMLATIAAGPAVPLIGSSFGGNVAQRAIGETAVNAAGMALSDYGGDKVAEHTDNPWLEGAARLGFGVVGAGGIIAGAKAAKNAPRALSAVDDAIAGLDARIMEPTGGGMGRPVTAGSVRDVPGGSAEIPRPVSAKAFSQTAPEAASYIGPHGEFLDGPQSLPRNTAGAADHASLARLALSNASLSDDEAIKALSDNGYIRVGTAGKEAYVSLEKRPSNAQIGAIAKYVKDSGVEQGSFDLSTGYSLWGGGGSSGSYDAAAFIRELRKAVEQKWPLDAPPRIPGELRAGPTMDEAAAAGTAGRAAANPATLTDTELAAAINRADNMVAKADTAAENAVRVNGPSAPETIDANRTLAMLEDDAERLRDEAAKRGGVAGLAAKLNDETGAVDMGAIGERFGEAGRRVGGIFADAAEKEGRPTTGGIFDMLAPTERAGTGAIRRYEGAMGTAGLDLRADLDAGNRLLRSAKTPGRWDGTRFSAARTPEIEGLYKALHGEGAPPEKYQAVFDLLKPQVDKEAAATIGNDPAFVPRDDYFYRGWREVPVKRAQNAGTGKGQFGATPGFMKPRSDQSFSDILDTVYTKADGSQVRLEPVSWNPFEMVALRKAAGEQFRAQTDLLAGLKEIGQVVPAEAAPPGWRIPRVGPAFEGKPFAYTPDGKIDPSVGYTERFAVPDKVANDIEAIFGTQPSFGRLDAVFSAGQKAKQAKLLMSLFQQMDFGARTFGALTAGVLDELGEVVIKTAKLQGDEAANALYRAGRKFIAIPKDLAELPLANLSGRAQRNLRAGILSDAPIFKERPGITLKGLSEAGTKFGTDVTLISRDLLGDIAKGEKPDYLTGGAVARRLRQVNAASQRGLFDGWYVQAQSTALKKTILPRIMRQHPDWTDAQIMAASSDQVNKMFSTLGEYQGFIKNPAVKKLARGLFFSTNEAEALLRGAASTVTGPNKRLWTEYYLGTFISLAVAAEAIHYATTGEHLPMERLNPIDTNAKNGPIPFGYRSNFLAPDIPIKGRNNTPLTLDLVQQMDTVFRVLDPKGFLASRENVLPRAATNQLTGKDFYGRPLKNPKDRISQAAIDILEPIGLGNLRSATGYGPDSEARVGKGGLLIQSVGGNVRAERNAPMRDRLALEWAASTGATKSDGSPIKGWDDLDTLQRPAAMASNPSIQKELEQRGDDAVKQGAGYAVDAASRELAQDTIRADNVRIQTETDAKYIKPGTTIPKSPDDGKAWRDDYDTLMFGIGRQYKAGETLDPYTGKVYGSDMDNAIKVYFDEMEKARNGVKVDFDKFEAWKADHPKEVALVDKYLAGKENNDLTEVVTAKKAASKAVGDSGYFDLRDGAWGKVKKGNPSMSGYDSFDDYRAAIHAQIAAQVPNVAPIVLETMVDGFMDNNPVGKIYSEISKADRLNWIRTHPTEAKLAYDWGYLPSNLTPLEIAIISGRK